MENYLEFTFGSAKSRVVFTQPSAIPFTEADLIVTDGSVPALRDLPSERLATIGKGENAKTFDSVSRILATALDRRLSNHAVFLGLGGGIACDLAGFAASVWQGGCRLILVPTTLAAQADAAIGGYAALNSMPYRDVVSTVHPAERVFVCGEFLTTLGERDYRSSLAEVIRTGMVEGPKIFSDLQNEREAVLARKPELLAELVRRSIQVKGSVFMHDPRGDGQRRYLSLGHQFAHGLETASGFSVSHGEAVAWGLARAMKAGEMLKLTDGAYAGEVRALLAAYGYPLVRPEVGADAILDAMRRDGARSGQGFSLVLQRDLCSNLVEDVDEAFIRSVLED
jgi:3-dehydroquinate synthase